MFFVSEFTTSPMRHIAVEGSVDSFTAPRIAVVAVRVNQAGGDVEAAAINNELASHLSN